MVVQLILAVSVAIIVSALCSVAEAALYSIPQSQVEVLARSGRLSGRMLAALRREIARPITAILTLNTVANTMGAAVAGAAAAAVLGERLLPLFSLGFTLAILFFSEIIPKTVGVAHSRTIAPLIAVPLAGLVRLLTPLIALCQIVTRFVSSQNESNLVSTDEITALASLSRRSGIIDLQQEKIIRNIVQLRGKSVRQAMTPRTVVCSLDQHMTVGAAMSIRQEWDRHSRIPVYDQGVDDIVGMVMGKEILLLAADDRPEETLAAITKPIHFVPETASLYTVLMEFFERHQHLFAVVDEYGSFTGLLSLEDVIEEIVGREIVDESDKTVDLRSLARQRRSRQVKSNNGGG